MAIGRVSTNGYATARFIVDTNGISTGATHSTIASALTDAVSGQTIFIRPGTYTENLTLKAGVDLVSFAADASTPNTIIVGKLTATFAGTCSISGIRLQTNSDNFLVVSGSDATIVNLEYCNLNCTNATGIVMSSSSASSRIFIKYCSGDLATTGIALWVNTGAGTLRCRYSSFTNSGGSTAATTCSAGFFELQYVMMESPISTTSTGYAGGSHNRIDCSSLNTAGITMNGTGGQSNWAYSLVASGTASAISYGAGVTGLLQFLRLNSSNTNVITGSGGVTIGVIDFEGSSSGQNVTTLAYDQIGIYGTWTPTIVGSGSAGTTTYTTQVGQYHRIGKLVWAQARIVITAATGTGDANVSLPFTVKNVSNGNVVGSIHLNAVGWAWPASKTQVALFAFTNTTVCIIPAFGSSQASSNVQMTNAAGSFTYSIVYEAET